MNDAAEKRRMAQKPIDVLQFSHSTARGGVEEHILSLMRGLDRKLFQLHYVCSPAVADAMRSELPADVELIPMHIPTPTQHAAAYHLAKILRSRRVGILHSHQFRSSLFASPIGWLCRVPVIVETPHIRELWRRGWKAHFWVDRLVSRFVDRYIAVSDANAKYLTEVKGLPATKMTVIKSACPVERFDVRTCPPAGLKESLGFADSDPVLLVVGRLEPQKGHRFLLSAMPAVLSEFPRVKLVCVGEGSLREELEAQAHALRLGGAVRFLGRVPDVRQYFAMAEFTVLPSLFEGLPLVAIESLAAGRPVVATAVDGTPEVVLDGRTGLLAQPADPASLSSAIRRMLRDPDMRVRTGRAGREVVAAQFTERKLIRDTERLYLDCWEAACH